MTYTAYCDDCMWVSDKFEYEYEAWNAVDYHVQYNHAFSWGVTTKGES